MCMNLFRSTEGKRGWVESEMKCLHKETGIQNCLTELNRNNYMDVSMLKESTEQGKILMGLPKIRWFCQVLDMKKRGNSLQEKWKDCGKIEENGDLLFIDPHKM